MLFVLDYIEVEPRVRKFIGIDTKNGPQGMGLKTNAHG
jgi:hypothetical protein